MLNITRSISSRLESRTFDSWPIVDQNPSIDRLCELFVCMLKPEVSQSKTDHPLALTPQEVRFAIDEFLLTTECADLSSLQKALCGIALLEIFMIDPEYGRGSPDTTVAVLAIMQGVHNIDSHAKQTIMGLCALLSNGATATRFHPHEIAELRVLHSVLMWADVSSHSECHEGIKIALLELNDSSDADTKRKYIDAIVELEQDRPVIREWASRNLDLMS